MQLTREESYLDLSSLSARMLHNKVRAFAGWPGTRATLFLEDRITGGDVDINCTAVIGVVKHIRAGLH